MCTQYLLPSRPSRTNVRRACYTRRALPPPFTLDIDDSSRIPPAFFIPPRLSLDIYVYVYLSSPPYATPLWPVHTRDCCVAEIPPPPPFTSSLRLPSTFTATPFLQGLALIHCLLMTLSFCCSQYVACTCGYVAERIMSSECSVFSTRKFWAVGRFLVLIRCILPGSRSSVERVLYVLSKFTQRNCQQMTRLISIHIAKSSSDEKGPYMLPSCVLWVHGQPVLVGSASSPGILRMPTGSAV